MKKLVFFILTVLFFRLGSAWAQGNTSVAIDEEIISLMKASSTYHRGTLPVTYLLVENDYIIAADGRTSKKVHLLIKIIDERGKDFGDIVLPYNSYFQELEIIKARTILSDGTVVNVSEDAIQDKNPYTGYPMYSDIKYRQFSFPRLEPGNFIEYEVCWKDKKPIFEKGYFDCMEFVLGFLTHKVRLSLNIPAQMEVKYHTFKISEPNPIFSEDAGTKTYVWNSTYIFPTQSYELAKPPYRDIGPLIFFTTIKTWDDVASWFRKLAEGQDAPDATVRQKVREIVGSELASDEKEKDRAIRLLFSFVQKNIRYVATELKEAAYKPYPASEVLANQYGDCKGKSALFISMLKALNIPAFYGLVRTRGMGRQLMDFPSFDFNHCIVAIPREDGFLFLDPTYENSPFGKLPSAAQGMDIFVVTEDGYKFSSAPVYEPQENANTSVSEIKFIADNEVLVKDETMTTGELGVALRAMLKTLHPIAQREYFGAALNMEYPGAKLNKLEFFGLDDTEVPLKTTSDYRIKNFADKAGGLLMFTLSENFSSHFLAITGSETRKYPLWFNSIYLLSQKSTVILPEGYKVKFLPADVALDESFASYHRKFTQDKEEKIYFEEEFVLKKREIWTGKYGVFKKFITKVGDAASEKLILEKAAPVP